MTIAIISSNCDSGTNDLNYILQVLGNTSVHNRIVYDTFYLSRCSYRINIIIAFLPGAQTKLTSKESLEGITLTYWKVFNSRRSFFLVRTKSKSNKSLRLGFVMGGEGGGGDKVFSIPGSDKRFNATDYHC